MDAKVINHWGKWIESNTPTTGVVSNNEISQFISDELYNGINLTYNEALEEFTQDLDALEENYTESDIELEETPEERRARMIDQFNEEWEDQPSDTWIIGDWIKDGNGQYGADPSGEYAAIVGESETQVVFSKYTRRGNPCSPCFPGQVEFSNDGDFLAYDLPPEASDTEY